MNELVISKILEEVTINEHNQIFVNNIPINNSLSNAYQSKELVYENLSSQLTKVIYFTYFVNVREEGTKSMLPELLKVYKYRDKLIKNFQIDFVGKSGDLIVSNRTSRLLVLPGEYILEKTGYPRKGDLVYVWKNAKFIDSESKWFFTYGKAFEYGLYESQVRIYLNSTLKGVPRLMLFLKEELDFLHIGFTFKCLWQRPALSRPDNCVLYVEAVHLGMVFKIIKKYWKEWGDLLDEAVPIFTKRISKGIGFAESPLDKNISFGMSRCNLIARSIVKLLNTESNKTDAMDFVRHEILKEGYDLDHFYLNPGSTFPYDFSGFPLR